jgi:hypothetical protein
MDLPRRDLTGITVRVCCSAPGCTLDAPCGDCLDMLAYAEARAAARPADSYPLPVRPAMSDEEWAEQDAAYTAACDAEAAQDGTS